LLEPPPYNGASEHGVREPVEKSADNNRATETNKDGGFEKNRQRPPTPDVDGKVKNSPETQPQRFLL